MISCLISWFCHLRKKNNLLFHVITMMYPRLFQIFLQVIGFRNSGYSSWVTFLNNIKVVSFMMNEKRDISIYSHFVGMLPGRKSQSGVLHLVTMLTFNNLTTLAFYIWWLMSAAINSITTSGWLEGKKRVLYLFFSDRYKERKNGAGLLFLS